MSDYSKVARSNQTVPDRGSYFCSHERVFAYCKKQSDCTRCGLNSCPRGASIRASFCGARQSMQRLAVSFIRARNALHSVARMSNSAETKYNAPQERPTQRVHLVFNEFDQCVFVVQREPAREKREERTKLVTCNGCGSVLCARAFG